MRSARAKIKEIVTETEHKKAQLIEKIDEIYD